MIPDHWFHAGMGTSPLGPVEGGSGPSSSRHLAREGPEELIVLLLVCEGPQPGVGGGVLEKMHPRDGLGKVSGYR